MTGKLYLIGTGPGDPELLTLKAARLLGTVAVLAYPQKPGQESLALSIAAPQQFQHQSDYHASSKGPEDCRCGEYWRYFREITSRTKNRG